MRRRNNKKKVVPLNVSAEDLAAQKIQALYRGRKSRISSTDVKIKAISHILLQLKTRLTTLENASNIKTIEKDVNVNNFFDVIGDEPSSHNININDDNKRSFSFKDAMKEVRPDLMTEDNGSTTLSEKIETEVKEEELDRTYALSQSMWDVVLLIGLPEVGQAGSIFSCLLLIINILVQFVFVFIVLDNFTQESFSDDVILGFRSWRRNISHSSKFMEGITEVSLASRICNNDSGLELSGNQAVAHELLGNYITGGGSLMCILTIIMWLLTVAKEISACVSFCQAVYYLPRGNFTIINNEGNTIESLCRKRHAIVIAITTCRFIVVISLGYAGAAWLANTVRFLLLHSVNCP